MGHIEITPKDLKKEKNIILVLSFQIERDKFKYVRYVRSTYR